VLFELNEQCIALARVATRQTPALAVPKAALTKTGRAGQPRLIRRANDIGGGLRHFSRVSRLRNRPCSGPVRTPRNRRALFQGQGEAVCRGGKQISLLVHRKQRIDVIRLTISITAAKLTIRIGARRRSAMDRLTNREKRPRHIGLLETSSTRWPASPNAVMASRDDRLEPSLSRISAFVLPSGRCLGAHLKWAGA